MSVSVIETIKSRANAGNTAYIVVVKLLCDDYSDLPTQSELSGYELAQGCIAHVINENKDYMIDSSGNWHVYGGDSWTNVYTKSETDALLDDKQDELTTAQLDAVNSGITAAKLTADEAAIVELVDDGAKNLLQFDYISGSTAQGGGTSWTSNGVEFSLANGEITVNRTSASSSDATCQLYLGNSKIYIDSVCDGGHILSGCPSGGSTSTYMFGAYRGNYTAVDTGSGAELGTTTQTLVYLQITIKASYSPSNLKFRPMICTAADWAISHKFVPYRPSMQEMYQMILALQ